MELEKIVEKRDYEKNLAIEIAKIVSTYYEKPLDEIFVRSRKREVVLKRQLIQNLVKYYTNNLSLNVIGNLFEEYGSTYDHSTILHSIRTVENEYDTNKYFRNDYKNIKDEINEYLSKINQIHRSPVEKELLEFRMKIIRACRISRNKEVLQNELIAIL